MHHVVAAICPDNNAFPLLALSITSLHCINCFNESNDDDQSHRLHSWTALGLGGSWVGSWESCKEADVTLTHAL
eukprot:m.160696 g.160696  ORF g.160696 m.160696 type:complete len:74 (-) comp23805_c1_seq1:263-484(-)